jgi:hypothetical protein
MTGNENTNGRPGLTVGLSADGLDVVVSVSGELDLATAPQLHQVDQVAGQSCRYVILDLARLAFSANNLAYVRHLFAAFSRGGAERFAALVPHDVEWYPVDVRLPVRRTEAGAGHEL